MSKTRFLLPPVVMAATLATLAFQVAAAPVDAVTSPRLYAIDCGRIETKDMGAFADTGEYEGKSGTLIDSCYLVRHPKGTLIWDTGLGDALGTEGKDLGFAKVTVPKPLLGQLESIGVNPASVDYLAFSHTHFDHTGNANAFTGATWILNAVEMHWAESMPAPFGVEASTFSAYKSAKTQIIDGDYDVFGDGTVKILKTPGHTPGHGVLQVKLKRAGVVVLSGDLYHTHANRTAKRIPSFNVSRADTLASIDRIERIVKNTHAHLVVQHDPNDFATLPTFPAYLD